MEERIVEIYEIRKGVINASDFSGLMLVNLDDCDALLIPEGSGDRVNRINPTDILMCNIIKGKIIDILSEITE